MSISWGEAPLCGLEAAKLLVFRAFVDQKRVAEGREDLAVSSVLSGKTLHEDDYPPSGDGVLLKDKTGLSQRCRFGGAARLGSGAAERKD